MESAVLLGKSFLLLKLEGGIDEMTERAGVHNVSNTIPLAIPCETVH
jgi:hypothetical protein